MWWKYKWMWKWWKYKEEKKIEEIVKKLLISCDDKIGSSENLGITSNIKTCAFPVM